MRRRFELRRQSSGSPHRAGIRRGFSRIPWPRGVKASNALPPMRVRLQPNRARTRPWPLRGSTLTRQDSTLGTRGFEPRYVRVRASRWQASTLTDEGSTLMVPGSDPHLDRVRPSWCQGPSLTLAGSDPHVGRVRPSVGRVRPSVGRVGPSNSGSRTGGSG